MKLSSLVRRTFGRNAFKQFQNLEFLMFEYGQWISIKRNESINQEAEPVPWYSYPALEYLTHLDFAKFTVFEYGSGNSTLWWAKRAQRVVSVEDDEIWFEKTNSKAGIQATNVSCYFVQDKEKYVSMASEGYDIFIVDGKHRTSCVEHILNVADKGLMIILDNSDWFQESVDLIRQKTGWIQVDFHGFGPINNYTTTTSVFININRSQELTYLHPLKSRCGIVKAG